MPDEGPGDSAEESRTHNIRDWVHALREARARFTAPQENPYHDTQFLTTMRGGLEETARALRIKQLLVDIGLDEEAGRRDDRGVRQDFGAELAMADIWARIDEIRSQPGWTRNHPARLRDPDTVRQQTQPTIGESCAESDCPMGAVKRWRGEIPLCQMHYQRRRREDA